MPLTGLEPVRCIHREILSLLRASNFATAAYFTEYHTVAILRKISVPRQSSIELYRTRTTWSLTLQRQYSARSHQIVLDYTATTQRRTRPCHTIMTLHRTLHRETKRGYTFTSSHSTIRHPHITTPYLSRQYRTIPQQHQSAPNSALPKLHTISPRSTLPRSYHTAPRFTRTGQHGTHSV